MASSEKTTYDVAIIGGGIAGAGIARDASMRGLRVILFEKNTIASGTSSKTSKLIHGGIRYLEVAWNALLKRNFKAAWKNFRFVFSSLRETHCLNKIASNLIQPLPLLVPIYKSKMPALFVFMGTLLYGFMSLLAGGKHFPKIFFTAKSFLKEMPDLSSESLCGGVLIWDHVTDDKKLTEALIESAKKNGAEIHVKTPVLRYKQNKDQSGYEIEANTVDTTNIYYAKKIINASGPWVDEVRENNKEFEKPFIAPIGGSHIHLPLFLDKSIILRADDERIFFVINHQDYCRIGTTEWTAKQLDNLETPEEDVQYLFKQLRFFFPKLSFSESQILHKDSGIRPLARPEGNESAHSISREHEVRIGPSGVWHVLGVKITDHRRAAKQVVDQLMPFFVKQGYPNSPCRTGKEPL